MIIEETLQPYSGNKITSGKSNGKIVSFYIPVEKLIQNFQQVLASILISL